jgi:hypothetical protein
MAVTVTDTLLGMQGDALSPVPSASVFTSLCKTLAAHPATVQTCVLSSFIGLAQAAAVDQSSQTPTLQNKTRDVLLPVFSFLLVASLVAVW